ncbi:hypothetical protein GCM10009799_33610 [Nocardiopsis rhodophaea]|uniref:Glycosyl transferase family 25 domain-containing protein n=1 Tax=Nocardiopsis rhodophaea TaxID=280238 RepID=A0ABN2TB40_9ACTN
MTDNEHKCPSVAPADVGTYVINLKRRPDRRQRILRQLPLDLPPLLTSYWQGPFDGVSLKRSDIEALGYRLFEWRIDSDNPWWNRPLKYGEIGCSLAHLSCWQHADTRQEPFTMVLEDDAELAPCFLDSLLSGLQRLGCLNEEVDLVYLGRYPLTADTPAPIQGFVRPGYSHCTFGYLLTRSGLKKVLKARLGDSILPVDEFLPALYIDHPRPDVRRRFPRCLNAFAFSPPLVTQLPKDLAGSDTEDSPFVENVS